MRAGRFRAAGIGLVLVLLGAAIPPAQAITAVDSHETPTGGAPPAGPGERPPQDLTRLSDTPDGLPGGGDSFSPDIAPDAPEVVAFLSDADDLTPDDRNGRTDVFVSDPELTRISHDPPGAKIRDVVAGPALSGPGDVVVWGGEVDEPGAGEPTHRVVITDRKTGRTELAPAPPSGGDLGDVDVSPDGKVVVWEQDDDIWVHERGREPPGPTLVSRDPDGQPVGGSSDPDVSEGGSRIVFCSTSPRLVSGDTNGASDVFVRNGGLTNDPGDDEIRRIPVTADGSETDGPSCEPAISPDGTRVVLTSYATNVVDDDTNGTGDVFVHALDTGTTTRITDGDGPSGGGAISPDGGYVTFASGTGDPPPGDAPDPGSGRRPAPVTPTSFQVVDRSGARTFATSILEVDGPRVRVGFPEPADLRTGSAGSVDTGTLIDHQVVPLSIPTGRSNTNPLATRGPTRRDGNGLPLPPADDITDGPDLTSARVVPDDNGTPDEPGDDVPAVRYCFDEPLGGILERPVTVRTGDVATDRFLVGGHNSWLEARSQRATVEPEVAPEGRPSPCLRVRFAPGVDPARFTLAAVIDDAVVDRDGQPNIKASTALAGTAVQPRAGDVTGPNLRSARIDFLANTATFVFDDLADTGRGADPATRLLFVDPEGAVHPGRRITAVDPEANTVTVGFNLGSGDLVDARRFVALPDAVRNAAGEPNVEQSTDGDVDGPELTSVDRVDPAGGPGPPRYDFVFNRPVGIADATRFFLYTEDGTRFPVASLTRPKTDVVRVKAPAVGPFAEAIVLGLAEARAVFESLVDPGAGDTAGAPNPLGTKPAGARPAPAGSISDGPDLQSVDFHPDVHAVDFVFDEPVRDVHLVLRPGGRDLETEVFVRELDTGRVERVPGDSARRRFPGGRWSPRISRWGRFVSFGCRTPLSFAARTRFRQVCLGDLLRVRVAPAAIDFGEVRVDREPSPPRTVMVTNFGFGRLAVKTVVLAGDHPGSFEVRSDRCSGRTLRPRAACRLQVAFAPAARGVLTGRMVVIDNAPGRRRSVSLRGRGLLPPPLTLTVSPPLGPPGTVAMVEGNNFPPGAGIELRWASSPDNPTGLAPLPSVTTLLTDCDGSFPPEPLMVLPGDVVGPRILEAWVLPATPINVAAAPVEAGNTTATTGPPCESPGKAGSGDHQAGDVGSGGDQAGGDQAERGGTAPEVPAFRSPIPGFPSPIPDLRLAVPELQLAPPKLAATESFLVVPGTVQPSTVPRVVLTSFRDTLPSFFVRWVQLVSRR